MPRKDILRNVDHAVFEFKNKIELQLIFYKYCKMTANITKMEFDLWLQILILQDTH